MSGVQLEPGPFFRREPDAVHVGDRLVGLPIDGYVSALTAGNLRLLADVLDRLECAYEHITVARLHDIALDGERRWVIGAAGIEGAITAARRRSGSGLITMRLKVKTSEGRNALRASLEIVWDDPSVAPRHSQRPSQGPAGSEMIAGGGGR